MTRRRTAGVLLIGAAVLAGGCSQPEPEAVLPDLPVVPVVEARIATLRNPLVAAGQVVPATRADWTLVAPEPARIARLPVGLGDAVAAGDLLVEFDLPSVTRIMEDRQLAAAQARARFETATSEAERIAGLYARGIVARNRQEAAQAEQRAAEAALGSAEAYLAEAQVLADQAKVTARFAGVVSEVWHVEGDLVAADSSDPILRVIDPTQIEIAVPVPVEHLARLTEGRPATFQAVGFAEPGTAVISRRLAPRDATATTAEIRLTPEHAEGLTLETLVQVEILLDERRDVVAVPVSALVRDSTSSFVMVVDDNGRVWRRNVRVGLVMTDQAEITDGLAPGEAVVASGAETLLDGAYVTIAG